MIIVLGGSISNSFDLFDKSRVISYDINFMDLVPDYIIKDTNFEHYDSLKIVVLFPYEKDDYKLLV